ncbi:MAG: hypothetical protein N3D16_06930 [Anaerolineales bacterium]|nr:hypothetical protein [Anaerolineales bacterium]
MIPSIFLIGAILTPLFSFASLIFLQVRKVRLGFLWSSAFVGLALTWLFVLGLRFFLPHFVPLANWQPEDFFPISPELLADDISWVVGFALVSVGVAVILTEATTSEGSRAFGWACSVLLVGLGLFAIFAGNQLTLLLAWAAIDLVELAIWLSRPAQPTLRERVILAFSSRAFAVMLSLWGLGNPWAYLFAIILRWGVFPFHLPYLESEDLRRGLGTIIRLVPPLTTMPYLARLAELAYFSNQGWMAVLLGFIALFALILWMNSTDVLEGRPFWVIGTASFAFNAAVQGQPQTVLIYSLILAISGSFLFLTRERDRFSFAVMGYSAFLLLGLPYTPFWNLVRLYRDQISPSIILFFFAQALAILGTIRLILEKPRREVVGEPWSIALYRLAFLGLIGTSIMLGYSGWGKNLEAVSNPAYPDTRYWVEYVIGLSFLLLCLVTVVLIRLRLVPRFRLPSRLVRFFSMEWIYRVFQLGFRQIGSLFYRFEDILEGRGGVLWTIVLLFVLARFLLFLIGGG